MAAFMALPIFLDGLTEGGNQEGNTNMNCGILTLHNALNYGAFLQAFALKKTLEDELGCRANVVSLSKNRLAERLLLVKCKYPARVIHHIRFLREIDKVSGCLKIRKDGLSPYEAVIVGSDELWNLENNGFIHRPEYFGRGIAGKKIISYAVSSNAVTPERFRELTKHQEDFSCFDRISVRDLYTQRLVREVDGRNADIVIDPTLLLNDWQRFAVPCPKRGFILLYSMTVHPDERKAVEKLAKEIGKKIVTVGCYNPWCDESVYATPFEFLGYVQAADCIVTSQFHGVMFSAIFHKQFVIHPQNKPKVLDAMDFLRLEDRDVTGQDDLRPIMERRIDYEKIDQTLLEKREESLKWLKSAISMEHEAG